MLRMVSFWASWIVLASALVACGESEYPYDEYGMGFLCRDERCGWDVEHGSVSRAGSWHPRELGLSLNEAPTRVSRIVAFPPYMNCFGFEYVGNIDQDARVELRVDFNDDGSEEFRAALPTGRWEPSKIIFRTPVDYRRMRLRLDKEGQGAAVLVRAILKPLVCEASSPVLLGDGAECATDATCASGRCLAGHCASCTNGCTEGQACRDSSECRDGACANGVCRLCAKLGSCEAASPCTDAAQCASRTCVAGSSPGKTTFPWLDRMCGECDEASDCASGRCVLGQCSECATDADCGSGRSCRYLDLYEATSRGCAVRPASPLPRGALCEQDAECAAGLRCGAASGRAKRCGFACDQSASCEQGELCVLPAFIQTNNQPAQSWQFPSWSETAARIGTCRRTAASREPCEVHQQCGSGHSCCGGFCTYSPVDLTSGSCPPPKPSF